MRKTSKILKRIIVLFNRISSLYLFESIKENAIEELRTEIFSKKSSSIADDKKNLYEDRTAISGDIMRAFNKLISN